MSESPVERQIREAQERGAFDNLPGKGKPLRRLHTADDENWWVRGFVEREGLGSDVLLPTPLRLRKERERLPETVRDLPTEDAVREVVRALNARIAEWTRIPVGPRVAVRPASVEEIVAGWRVDRAARGSVPSPRASGRSEPGPGDTVSGAVGSGSSEPGPGDTVSGAVGSRSSEPGPEDTASGTAGSRSSKPGPGDTVGEDDSARGGSGGDERARRLRRLWFRRTR